MCVLKIVSILKKKNYSIVKSTFSSKFYQSNMDLWSCETMFLNKHFNELAENQEKYRFMHICLVRVGVKLFKRQCLNTSVLMCLRALVLVVLKN